MSRLTPGSTLGAYRIIEPLGRGGMATVFKAYEAALDRYVALKVLPAEFLHEAEFAARFEREAKVIAKLEHPNIVPIFAFGIEQGIPWMAMRLIGGGSLSGALKGQGVHRDRSVGIVRAVAEALTYAHALGVVHRDIKPQNILLDEHGRVYLADFGIARIVEGGTSITRTGVVSGTPQYMAPEQATGGRLDHRVDIYALGIVAYELLTGAAPFMADTPVAVLMKQVSAPIPIPPPDLVPESMLGPLLKCLSKDPEQRWATAAEFADALEEGMATATTQVGAAPIPPDVTSVAAPPVRRPPAAEVRRAGSSVLTWVLLLGLAVLLSGSVIVALLWLWLRPGPGTAGVSSPRPMARAAQGPAAPGAAQVEPVPVETPETLPRPEARSPGPAPASPLPTVPPPQPALATSKTRSAAVAANASSPPPATATPEPTPPPATQPPAPPPRPAGHPFRLNDRIDVGSPVVGPITLRGARFNTPRPGELELSLDFECAKGKDQMVSYEATLLDEAGQALLTLRGKKGLEEKDRGTAKLRGPAAPGVLEAARSFRVTFASVPD